MYIHMCMHIGFGFLMAIEIEIEEEWHSGEWEWVSELEKTCAPRACFGWIYVCILAEFNML